MDIMEFLEVSKKVCNYKKQSLGEGCELGCPFNDVCNLQVVDLLGIDENVVDDVQRYYDEKISGLKTRQQAYLAVFPKAPKDIKGIIDVCPKSADRTLSNLCEKYKYNCAMCRTQYWEGIHVTACMQ